MKKLKGFQPISITNNKILLYKKNKLYFYYESSDSYEHVLTINTDLKTRFLGQIRLLSRLFRKDIKSYMQINDKELFISFNRKIYYVSLEKKSAKDIFDIKTGFSEPLNYCIPLQGNTKFKVLFGDYGNNAERYEVSIYGIDNNLCIRKIFTFKKGDIRHIHNIIPDIYKDGYYIFTGDNEEKAGIYWVNADFSKLRPVFVGDQKARAVAGFVTPKGLLYAMDSISEKNYIWLLTESDQNFNLMKIGNLNGSVIYSTKYLSGYLLSTTVESEERVNNNKLSLLSVKRGKGILSNDVHLVHINENLDVSIIKKFRKDKFPFKLFQYGAIRFPNGMENYNSLIIYPNAIKKYDGNTMILNFLEDINQ